MKKLVALTAALAAISAINAGRAQTTIADWTFQTSASTNNIIGAGDTPGTTQSGVLADIGTGTASASHAGSATAWSIPAGDGSTNSWSSTLWAVGDYYQFQVSSLGFNNIGVSYEQVSSGTGPASFNLQYSLDGSSFTTFSSYTVTNSPSWSVSVAGSAAESFSYSLSPVTAVNNAASVYFRLVDANNAVDAAGTAAVGTSGTSRVDDFIVTGVPVPEPSALALAVMGSVVCLAVFRRRR
jgi:hypothetical protein